MVDISPEDVTATSEGGDEKPDAEAIFRELEGLTSMMDSVTQSLISARDGGSHDVGGGGEEAALHFGEFFFKAENSRELTDQSIVKVGNHDHGYWVKIVNPYAIATASWIQQDRMPILLAFSQQHFRFVFISFDPMGYPNYYPAMHLVTFLF